MPSSLPAILGRCFGARHWRPASPVAPGLILLLLATLVGLSGAWTGAEAAKSKKHHEAETETSAEEEQQDDEAKDEEKKDKKKDKKAKDEEAEDDAAQDDEEAEPDLAPLAPAPPPSRPRTRPDLPPVPAELSWSYVTSDWVGAESPPRPDGIADGHFQLRVVAAHGLLVGLALCASNPRGTCGSQSWSLAPTPDERPLALVRDGRLVDENNGGVLARIDGEATFDLYAADVGWFRDGNWMLARGLLEDGRMFEALLQIP